MTASAAGPSVLLLVATVRGMTRTRLTVTALALAVALTGCGDSSKPAAAPPTSAAPSASATARPAAIDVECANIDRAHNAWDGPRRPQSGAAVAAWNELDIKTATEDGDDYLKAVSGYEDQPSKALAVAIAEYNFELSLVNAEMVIGDGVGEEQAGKAAGAAGKVVDEYRAWRSATCA